jgi:ERCC4-type nuclease
MKVQISDKEQNRIKQAEEYFTSLGCETEVTNLQYGDYVFDGKVAIEYKTMADFFASIQDHRVFNEAINQAENYDWHYVLIHGNEHERTKCIAMSKNYVPVNLFQFHGAIASINRYSTVIECYSPFINEAFYKMYIQAKKDLSTKPIVKKFNRKDKNPAFNFLCHDVYGINSKKAQLIVDTYNLNNLVDLFTLTWEDLLEIKGIGEDTAKRIIEALYGGKRYYLSETHEEVWKK